MSFPRGSRQAGEGNDPRPSSARRFASLRGGLCSRLRRLPTAHAGESVAPGRTCHRDSMPAKQTIGASLASGLRGESNQPYYGRAH